MVAAYLARFTSSSSEHPESELGCSTWTGAAGRGLEPLAARAAAEVSRALHAQTICETRHGRTHEVFDREVN